MRRRRNKYIEVRVNFPGNTIAEDEQMNFCIDGASEHKAAQLAKGIAREHRRTFSGFAERKDKRKEQR